VGNIKGCSNESCEIRKNKIKCKKSDAFCSRCGSPLTYVCKDCYTQLPDANEKYCVRCKAKHEGKIPMGAAGGIAATLGIFALKFSKKAFETIKNIKG